jgi:DNA-binding NarL/FixJ family response regulator
LDQALRAAKDRSVVNSSHAEARQDADSVRVFVIDDDRLFREALAALLRANELEVVGASGGGETAMTRIAEVQPDVVLMDVQMPEIGGIEMTRRLREAVPDARVLILTVSGAEEDVLEAMFAGAVGYLVKGTSPEALVAGIRAAAAGGALLSPGIATKLLGRIRAKTPSALPTGAALLTDRELEVLELLARGQPNAEIARTLFLSPNTVRNHISNILQKLQISNRTEATAYAIRAGLV